MALIIERVLDSGFDFILDGGVPIRDNEPNLTTIGNICHFKTKNGAFIIRDQNITYADITVRDTFGGTGDFTFVNIQSLWVKLIELKFFAGIGFSSNNGGINTFQGLLDTDAYFGNDGKGIRVNESEQKLEYFTIFNYNKLTQMNDVEIAALTDGKILGVAMIGGEPKVTLVDKPKDGTTYFSAVGGFDYNDEATSTTPLSYTSGDLQLTNDALGEYTYLSQPPYGITGTWNEINNTFNFNELSVGDEVFLRIHIVVTTTTNNQVSGLKMLFGEGTDDEYQYPIDLHIEQKQSGTLPITRETTFQIRDNNWRTTPAKLLFESSANASVIVVGWHTYIVRKSINILDVQIKGSSEKPAYITATENQTIVNIDSSVGNLDVWVDRVYQIEGVDYARNPSNFTFNNPLRANSIVSYRTFTEESVKEEFLATDGQTDLEMSNSPRTIDVWVNRIPQIEGIDYNKSGNMITFTYNLRTNDYVIVRKHR